MFNSTQKIDKTYRKHVTGSEVSHYFINWSNTYLKYGEWIAAPRDPKFFEGERVIIREIPSRSRLRVAYTKVNYTVKNTGHIFIPKKGYNAKLLCAILNSKLIGFYFVNKFSERDEVFPKAKIGQCRLLPIINVKNTDPGVVKLIGLVDSILKIKEADPDSDISVEEAKIDKLVYKLYGLTEEEVGIVEGV